MLFLFVGLICECMRSGSRIDSASYFGGYGWICFGSFLSVSQILFLGPCKFVLISFSKFSHSHHLSPAHSFDVLQFDKARIQLSFFLCCVVVI